MLKQAQVDINFDALRARAKQTKKNTCGLKTAAPVDVFALTGEGAKFTAAWLPVDADF
jgi:hypothetical protein